MRANFGLFINGLGHLHFRETFSSRTYLRTTLRAFTFNLEEILNANKKGNTPIGYSWSMKTEGNDDFQLVLN